MLKSTSRTMRALATAGVATTCAATLFAQAKPAPIVDAPTFPKGTPVVTVPYTRDVDFNHLGSLHVNLSFNGGAAHGYQVDTGSVGIMAPASEIPNFDGKGEPGEITYSSSGVHLMGVWTTVDVTFADAASPDGKPVTARIPILAVTKKDCTGAGVNAAKCEPGPANPHMLGIGFGRGPADKYEAQKKNAFVMLNAMQSGSMRRGYIISPAGIQLGLNADSVTGHWVWQGLATRSGTAGAPATYIGPRDYDTTPGSFDIDGKRVPMGSVLMDTGLTNMMLAAPGGPQTGEIPAGTPVRINLLGGRLSYDFRVNDPTNPTTPRKVNWVGASHGVYVNTGLRSLALFDYCYDADGGYLGLKPRAK